MKYKTKKKWLVCESIKRSLIGFEDSLQKDLMGMEKLDENFWWC